MTEAPQEDAWRDQAEHVLHDVSNLLMSLVATLSLLRCDEDATASTRRSARAVEDGLFVIAGLLEGLRTRPARSPTLGAIDVVSEVRRHQHFWRGCAGEHVHFVLDLQAAELPWRLSKTDLFRILVNLLGNAAEATPPGGTITLRCATGPEGWGWVEVCDDGTGMTQDDIERMFCEGQSNSGSTGLGMGTVRGLVQRAGGSLQVSSAPARGTCMRIELRNPTR